jgi:PKD repeat protein
MRSFQPPVADFTYSPIAPTPGLPVGFDGSASRDFDGQIVDYAWDFDADGRTDATGPAAVWVFRASGSYSVSLTVTDDGGSHDTASYVVELTAPPTPSAPTPTSPETQAPIAPQETQAPPPAASSSTQPPIADIEFMPLAPTAGEPVTFSGEPSVDLDGAIVGYEWDLDSDGFVDATDAVTVYVFAMSGTFEVRLTVTDDGGNTDTLVVEIEVR